MSEPFLALIYLTTPPHDNCPVLKEMYAYAAIQQTEAGY